MQIEMQTHGSCDGLGGYKAAAAVLVELTSASDGGLGEVDYDRRLGAYKSLQHVSGWLQFGLEQLPVVVQAVVKDLQREGELALRQEAAAALEALYAAAG